jgi:hypothetical protein
MPNTFPAAGAAAVAISLLFTGAADAAAAGKVAATEALPSTQGLSAPEIKEGLRTSKLADQSIAMRMTFSYVCSPDQSQQFVVPFMSGYNVTASQQHKVGPQGRLAALKLVEERASTIIAEMAANPMTRDMLANGMGTPVFVQRMKDFGDGVVFSSRVPIVTSFMGPIVLTDGCGTVTSEAAYKAAYEAFVAKLKAKGEQSRLAPAQSI